MSLAEDELVAASLVDLAVDRLRHEVLSGVLPPGTRLVEEQVRKRFGISRAPLREALRRLSEQGLVEHLPRRGVRVAALSRRDVEELFDVRDVLERHAVALALGSGVLDLAGLRRELGAMRSAAEGGDAFTRAQAHRAFHTELVALAAQRQLLLAYVPVLVRLQLHMAVNLRREEQARAATDGVRRHEVLLAALATDDVDTAVLALARHGAQTYL